MRYLIIWIMAVGMAGCRTHPREGEVSRCQVTSEEAQLIARIHIIALRGACGTYTGGIRDGGDCWRVQTFFGLSEVPGPELWIDKRTCHVTLAGELRP